VAGRSEGCLCELVRLNSQTGDSRSASGGFHAGVSWSTNLRFKFGVQKHIVGKDLGSVVSIGGCPGLYSNVKTLEGKVRWVGRR